MEIERNVIIAILKLTKDGPISREMINKHTKVPIDYVDELLQRLQKEDFIYVEKASVRANQPQRLRLAVKALSLGADFEAVSSLLSWREFEHMAETILERSGYDVAKNVHFKYAGRKWEIDIIGCRNPLALCIDCKHWHQTISPSSLKRIVEKQVLRTKAFIEVLPKLEGKVECASWKHITLIPAVLSLTVGRFKFYYGVPIVPILQMQNFLSQVPAYVNSLRHFTKI